MRFAPDVEALCSVIHAASRIDGAVGGMLHLISDHGCDLVAHFRLPQEFLSAFQKTVHGDGTTVAQACSDRRRVAVRDVRADQAFAPYREVAAAAGVVAMQSMPLADDLHRVHGVLTTCFDRPHHPGPESLDSLECCASIAAKVMVAIELSQRLESPDRLTSQSKVASAATAVRALLPVLERDSSPELLHSTEKKLTDLVQEMSRHVVGDAPRPDESVAVDELHCD